MILLCVLSDSMGFYVSISEYYISSNVFQMTDTDRAGLTGLHLCSRGMSWFPRSELFSMEYLTQQSFFFPRSIWLVRALCSIWDLSQWRNPLWRAPPEQLQFVQMFTKSCWTCPVVRSIAVALISVSPNFILTWQNGLKKICPDWQWPHKHWQHH